MRGHERLDADDCFYKNNKKIWERKLSMLNKSLGKSVLMTALITGSVIWGGTVVHAEEPQQFLLDEYVVTATRMENKLVDTLLPICRS